jgi:hypothetical protein
LYGSKRQLKTLTTILLALCFVAPVRAATINAASSSYADVNTAVNTDAARGDTVLVPAGTSAWGSELSITRGVRLRGNGIGSTIITRSGNLIAIAPDATGIANDEIIEVSGFTMDGNDSAGTLITVQGAGATGAKSWNSIIIATNKLQDTGTTTGEFASAIRTGGHLHGVIHSNTFDRCNVILVSLGSDDTDEWTNTAYNVQQYGTSNSLFFENNRIGWSTSGTWADPGWTETGHGAKLVLRYNDWNFDNVSSAELWDIHGWQNWNGTPDSGQTGTFVSEYYGNTVTNFPISHYRWIDHRGGWGLFFNNVATGSDDNVIDIYGVSSPGRCMSDVSPTPTYNGEITNSYFWNNSLNGTNVPANLNTASCGAAENVNWYNYNASFTGATGIGRGTATPSSTCTTGVGYWKASTATPTTDPAVIQAGAFYKATATDTWTAYYTPYTYPHPLAGATGSSGATANVGTLRIGP